jgi:NADH:ubiquinone oxidoreductase subunit 2 (subunit N)
MSLLAFLAIAATGAVLSIALRGRRWVGTVAGIGAVAAALAAVILAATDDSIVIDGVTVALTAYGRILLGIGLASGLGTLIVGRLAVWEPAAPGVLLVVAAGLGLALGVGGAILGLLAAGATAALASAVALAQPATPLRVRALARELRGAAIATTVGIVAMSLAPEAIGGLAVQPQVAGLAAVAAGVALGHRFGTIPLHARVARLTDAAPVGALPALLALLPAGWAVVFLAWGPATLGPAAPILGWDGTLLVLLGLTTLVLGAVAALAQDDLDRVVAYTIVLDAGVVILGFAALDAAGREAVRAWLVPFVATRGALVAWTIAFRASFGTTRLSEARGWLRRAPTLGVALVGIGLAAVGWPGFLVWDARVAALQAATAGPALLVASLASLGTAIALARVLGTGFGRPEARVLAASGELARVPSGLRAAARAMSRPEGRRRATLRAASREARPLLEMNRTPLRALLVVVLTGLALLAAWGAFGIGPAAALPDLPPPVRVEPTPDLPSVVGPTEEPELPPGPGASLEPNVPEGSAAPGESALPVETTPPGTDGSPAPGESVQPAQTTAPGTDAPPAPVESAAPSTPSP